MDYIRLKQLINEKGFTIKEIAEMSGITEPGLHRTLKNNTIQIKLLESICEILEINPGVLFECTNYNVNEDHKTELLDLLQENRELRKKLDALEEILKDNKKFHSFAGESIYKPKLKSSKK